MAILLVASAVPFAGACGALLGIEERRLRSETDGGGASAGAGGGGGSRDADASAARDGGAAMAGGGNAPADGSAAGACGVQYSNDECGTCLCERCEAPFHDACRGNEPVCNAYVSCVARTGCTQLAECESAGCAVPPGLDESIALDCIPQCATHCASVSSACSARFTTANACVECLCDASEARRCEEADCLPTARCILESGCAGPDCPSDEFCGAVARKTYADADAAVGELAMAFSRCPMCTLDALTEGATTPRDECARAYGGEACFPCLCNACSEAVAQTCHSDPKCIEAMRCVLEPSVAPECQAIPAVIESEVADCMATDCQSCRTAYIGGGTGGTGGTTGDPCDLQDNDGDGMVDEDSVWTTEPWRPMPATMLPLNIEKLDSAALDSPSDHVVLVARTQNESRIWIVDPNGDPGASGSDVRTSIDAVAAAATGALGLVLHSSISPCENRGVSVDGTTGTKQALTFGPTCGALVSAVGVPGSIVMAFDVAGTINLAWHSTAGGNASLSVPVSGGAVGGQFAANDGHVVFVSTTDAMGQPGNVHSFTTAGGPIDEGPLVLPAGGAVFPLRRTLALDDGLGGADPELVLLFRVMPQAMLRRTLLNGAPLPLVQDKVVPGDIPVALLPTGTGFVTVTQSLGGDIHVQPVGRRFEESPSTATWTGDTAPSPIITAAYAGSRVLLFRSTGSLIEVSSVGCL